MSLTSYRAAPPRVKLMFAFQIMLGSEQSTLKRRSILVP